MPVQTTASSRTLGGAEAHRSLEAAGCVEQVFDQSALRAGAALDRDERTLEAIGIQPPLPRQVDPAEDRGQRRPQLVRDHREEFVLEGVGGLRVGARGAFARQDAAQLVPHGAERAGELSDLGGSGHGDRLLEVPVLHAARGQRQPSNRAGNPLRREQRQESADAGEGDAAADERGLQRLRRRERFVDGNVRIDAGAAERRHRRERVEGPHPAVIDRRDRPGTLTARLYRFNRLDVGRAGRVEIARSGEKPSVAPDEKHFAAAPEAGSILEHRGDFNEVEVRDQ